MDTRMTLLRSHKNFFQGRGSIGYNLPAPMYEKVLHRMQGLVYSMIVPPHSTAVKPFLGGEDNT